VNTFGDIKGRQWGIILYTRANYTSTTDPVSGWRRNLYLKKGKGEEMRKQILNFTSIGYDEKKAAFFFTYNPVNFPKGKGLAKEWTLRSNVERWKGKKNEKGIREKKKVEDITKQLKKLFTDNGFDLATDLLPQIEKKSDLPSNFYSELIWLIEVIMQIRNSDDQENDFILSPVEIDGKKFDSREYYRHTKKVMH
jgi:CRISPR-associated protein Cpf1